MNQTVIDNIETHNLINKGDNIVVGLSGGPDSVFLFIHLLEMKKKVDYNLYIAHINHGIRGDKALRDENYVKSLGEKYGIPVYVKKADMDGYAKEHGLSAEEAGREIRYNFFREILKDKSNPKIAVGHNKSDQVETILMRFFRGSGIDGLKGMDFKYRDIIRPILNIDREDIETFLKDENIKYMIDHTNLETIYMRNKTRLELIPYIEKNYNENLIDTIFRNAENIKEDSDYLNKFAKEKYLESIIKRDYKRVELDIYSIKDLHKSIVSRIIRHAIEFIKKDLQGITSRHIDDVLDLIDKGRTGKKIDLPGSIKAEVSYGALIFKEDDYIEENNGFSFTTEVLYIENIKNLETTQSIKYFDYDKIKGELSFRYRENGDIFYPLGMKGKKKLKDFFIDEKISREKRDTIPLITDEDNILWVVGYRISELYKIDSNTKKVLKIKLGG